jgi:acyl-CoA synthetase (AMP-forming)/AMP-acid ligase II/peptidoglycan/LPS O-acetylase OafA/YrhL
MDTPNPPIAPRPVRSPLRLLAGLGAHGDRPALVADEREIAYAELVERVADRAAELGNGRRLVAVRGGNDVETVVSYLAAHHAGHVPWLVAPGPGGEAAMAAFGPDTVVEVAAGRADVEERSEEPGHALHPRLAMVAATSGSTGAPRLVRLSHRNLDANAAAIASYLEIRGDDAALTTLPMHYCYGLSVVHSHLLRGARLVLTDASVSDPAVWERARATGVTSFAGVPHTFELLDRVGFPDMRLPALRYVTQAGGRMPAETVARYAALGERRGFRLFVMYGQTEATARMAYLPPELAATRPQAIGVAIPGGAIELRPVPGIDEPGVGEIVYRGPNVMLGYAEHPADLARGREVRELATGDLGRRAPDGLLEVAGRRSRFVKPFGVRVDLDHVERLLAERGVEAACAGADERIVVATTARDADGVARGLASRLGLAPGAIAAVPVDALPRTPNGKPDYPGVAALAVADNAGPASSVAALFAEVLDVEDVGPGDTFAGLGGDSLSYVEASVALEEMIGRLPPSWPEMTVAELSARVPGGARRSRVARVEPDVALRAGAIGVVVGSHMTDVVPAGGAHVLLALAGYAFARFGLSGPGAGLPRRLATSASRIAMPTVAWIALMSLLAGGYGLAALFLVNDYLGPRATVGASWHYWYVEVLVQLLLVAAAVLAIPWLRGAERRAPWGFALAVLALALVPALLAPAADGPPTRAFLPHVVAWIFVLGWAAHRARTPRRRLALSVVLLVAVPGFFGDPPRELVLAAGVLALLWLPGVPVPRPGERVVGAVAAASLAIYLTHWQIWPPLAERMPTAVAWAATIAVGVGAWLLVERAGALRPLARRLAQSSQVTRKGRVGPSPAGGSGTARAASASRPLASAGTSAE